MRSRSAEHSSTNICKVSHNKHFRILFFNHHTIFKINLTTNNSYYFLRSNAEFITSPSLPHIIED